MILGEVSKISALTFRGDLPRESRTIGRIVRDPLGAWPDAALERPFIETETDGRRVVLIADPAAIGEILLNRTGDFPRDRVSDRILGVAFGEEMVRGPTLDWRKQRRQIAHPMSGERVRALAPRIHCALARLIEAWRARDPEAPLELIRDCRLLALDVLWRAFFCDEEQAQTLDPVVARVADAIDVASGKRLDSQRALVPLLEPLATRALDRVVRPADLGASGTADFKTIRVFLFAGMHSVATSLPIALWLLALHPEWIAPIREEWCDAETARPDPAAFPVTAAVMREVLRLYPPVVSLVREVAAEIDVGGTRIAPDFTAICGLYVMQRSRLYWEAPDAFRPERFLTGGDDIKRRLLWLPFGAGPRGCIGASFAQSEMMMAIAMILQAFDVAPVPGAEFDMTIEWTLRVSGRSPIQLRPRS